MIANLKPYPRMKDSGVEWLGAVPEHWEVVPLSRVLIQRKEKNDPIKTTNILSLSLKTGVVPYAEKEAGGNKAKEDVSAYMLAYPGDIVVNSMNVVVGSVGLSKYFGAVSPVYYMLRPRHEYDLVKYFDAIFHNVAFQRSLFGLGNGILFIESKSSGKLNTIRLRIPMTRLKRVVLPLPSPDEQAAIVHFLDHADRRIQRYIRAKQKLIKLLEEQKQAIIHRAVTRGLDPNVRLKPSGVEWLGEVPEHWEVRQLGRLGRIIKGNGGSKEDEVTEGVPCIRYGDIYTQYRFFIEKNRSYVSPERAADYTPINYGDVLFAASGETIEEIGKSAVNLIPVPAVCGGDVLRFTPATPVDPRFMGYVCDSPSSVVQKSLMGRGFTIMHLYGLQLKYLSLPLPPLSEQTAIANFLDTATTMLSSAIEKALREIDLFREYRTRLIADVVTGKLDVREVAANLPKESDNVDSIDHDEVGVISDFEGESADDPEEVLEEGIYAD